MQSIIRLNSPEANGIQGVKQSSLPGMSQIRTVTVKPEVSEKPPPPQKKEKKKKKVSHFSVEIKNDWAALIYTEAHSSWHDWTVYKNVHSSAVRYLNVKLLTA